ncbi:MAG: hypothetical protein KIT37_12120 [Steroidobacteraceae bacterium]|nr:hypothetical protein [Steroidobacteraceae bacterium]
MFLVIFAAVVFFAPAFGGLFLEPANFEPADPLSTPPHIAPAWYFAPYYAILRAVPDQRLGALAMLLAIVSFLFLPWLDRSRVRSIRYKGRLARAALAAFAISFIGLGFAGLQPPGPVQLCLARVFSLIWFAWFWLMPIHSKLDRTKHVPARVRHRRAAGV